MHDPSCSRSPLCAVLAALGLTLGTVGCGPSPEAQSPAAPSDDTQVSVVAPDDEPSEDADPPLLGAPPASDGSLGLEAATALKKDGSIDADALVKSAKTQIENVQACAALIRKTDDVVGSLNVELAIDGDGKVTADVQSPMNDEAHDCLKEGMEAWSIPDAGEGSAMLLLNIVGDE